MTTALSVLALLLGSGPGRFQDPAPQNKTFTNAALGLSFNIPDTWTQVKAAPAKKKKGKKEPEDDSVTFQIPGTTGSSPAELLIMRASFSAAPEKWQEIQVDANRSLRRNVEKQWQQEILGVPLLLTRIGYSQDGVAKTTLTGLLYNAAPYKLLFRLTGPTSSFETVEYQFTEAMQSLRTTSDTLPTAQEPNKPVAEPPKPDAKKTLFERAKNTGKPGPVALDVKVGDRAMVFRVPEGWSLEKQEGDTITLKCKSLPRPLVITLYAGATSERATEKLSAATNKTLDEFKTVELREDTPGTPNLVGNPVLAVWRRGFDAAKAPLATMDAIGVAGDYYAVFAYRPTPGEKFAVERKIVQAMLDRFALEPKP